MGSKLMNQKRTAMIESKERSDAPEEQRIIGAGSSASVKRNSNLGDDVLPFKFDPAAVLGGDSRFPSVLSYGEGYTGIGGFIFEDDSASVWYRPLTEAYFTGFRIYFHEETELVGTEVTIELRDVLDGPIVDPSGVAQTIDGNGEYDFTIQNEGIAPFMGDVLWSHSFDLTSSNLGTSAPVDVELAEAEWIDVEARDFAIALAIPGGGGADLLYYGGVNGSGIAYNHGIKWYHTGGNYCAPDPCWTPRLNFVVWAYVDYYGDPPPFVENVEDLDDVYYSCDPGSYTATADIYDVGTADFAGALTEVLFIYDDGSGPDTTDVTGQNDPTVGGTYTGTIPAIGVDGAVSYWWSATDNGDENPDGGVKHTTDLQRSPLSFGVHEYSAGADVLFITDTGTDADYMAAARNAIYELGYYTDDWNTFTMGVPTSCELGYYGTIIVGQGLNGYGAIGPDTGVEAASWRTWMQVVTSPSFLTITSMDSVIQLVILKRLRMHS